MTRSVRAARGFLLFLGIVDLGLTTVTFFGGGSDWRGLAMGLAGAFLCFCLVRQVDREEGIWMQRSEISSQPDATGEIDPAA